MLLQSCVNNTLVLVCTSEVGSSRYKTHERCVIEKDISRVCDNVCLPRHRGSRHRQLFDQMRPRNKCRATALPIKWRETPYCLQIQDVARDTPAFICRGSDALKRSRQAAVVMQAPEHLWLRAWLRWCDDPKGCDVSKRHDGRVLPKKMADNAHHHGVFVYALKDFALVVQV